MLPAYNWGLSLPWGVWGVQIWSPKPQTVALEELELLYNPQETSSSMNCSPPYADRIGLRV